jgi:quercetin dioxygenase-like cupin family protein
MKPSIFPEFVRRLPAADIPVKGLESHLVQGDHFQIVFMFFELDTDIPAHSHAEQWEIVLEGMVDVTIENETIRYQKGDRMHIPAGVVHSAFVHAGFCSMAFFDQPDRYKVLC